MHGETHHRHNNTDKMEILVMTSNMTKIYLYLTVDVRSICMKFALERTIVLATMIIWRRDSNTRDKGGICLVKVLCNVVETASNDAQRLYCYGYTETHGIFSGEVRIYFV